MNLRGMLIELRQQRQAIDRAITALEALQKRTGKLEKRVTRGGRLRETIEFEARAGQQKNGTTGVLIPFSRKRDQKKRS